MWVKNRIVLWTYELNNIFDYLDKSSNTKTFEVHMIGNLTSAEQHFNTHF